MQTTMQADRYIQADRHMQADRHHADIQTYKYIDRQTRSQAARQADVGPYIILPTKHHNSTDTL
jgi:hypothetical protein